MRAMLSHPSLPKLRSLLLPALALCLVGYGLWATFSALRPTKVSLRLGAGQSLTRRFQVGQYLAEEAAEQGLAMEVVGSARAQDTFAKWQSGEIDLALMSSGVTLPNAQDVRVVAGLNFEPLHIIVNRRIAETERSWTDRLRRLRVNIGEPGSNDYQLACELLRYLRVLEGDNFAQSSCRFSHLSKEELIEKARALGPSETEITCGLHWQNYRAEREQKMIDFPDVIFVVAPVPSNTAQALFDTGEYVLMPFPYAQSFITADLRREKPQPGQIDRSCLEAASIPASAYLGQEPIPVADCPTVGMRSVLVARASVPKATIKRLMYGIFGGDFARRIAPVNPRDLLSPHTIHPGAIAYLNRDKPIITENVFDIAGSALSIFGAFSAGALTLWGYVRRKRIRRPEEYLEEIRKVDLLAAGQANEHLNDTQMHQLDLRLVKLKEQLIHDYCGNRVQGEMVLLSILSMLSDSRTQLHRASPGRVEHPPAVPISEPLTSSAPRPTPGRDVLRNLRPAA